MGDPHAGDDHQHVAEARGARRAWPARPRWPRLCWQHWLGVRLLRHDLPAPAANEVGDVSAAVPRRNVGSDAELAVRAPGRHLSCTRIFGAPRSPKPGICTRNGSNRRSPSSGFGDRDAPGRSSAANRCAIDVAVDRAQRRAHHAAHGSSPLRAARCGRAIRSVRNYRRQDHCARCSVTPRKRDIS